MATRINIITLILLAIIPAAVQAQSLPYACAGSREAYGVNGLVNSVFDWTVEGGTIVDNQNDRIVVEWDMTRGIHRLQVVEINEYNCIGAPVTAQINVRAPEVDIGDEVKICADETYTFDAETGYDTQLSYLWQDSSTQSTLIKDSEGIVWVKVTGLDGCSTYDSATLVVNSLPVVELGPDTFLCGASTLELDAGVFAFYNWSTGQIINPVTIEAASGFADTLSVTVTDYNGCRSSDTIVVLSCDIDKFFADMPNTIIPGDPNNANRTWRINYIDLFPGTVVEIFDRWGRLIYHVKDPDPENVWNGKSMANKEMPMDSYYYVIDLNYKNSKPLVGTINIIR